MKDNVRKYINQSFGSWKFGFYVASPNQVMGLNWLSM